MIILCIMHMSVPIGHIHNYCHSCTGNKHNDKGDADAGVSFQMQIISPA